MSETGTPTAAAEATPSIEWIREFVEHWRDAWNSTTWDRLLALTTEDIEYRDDSWPRRCTATPMCASSQHRLAGEPGHDLRAARRALCDSG